VPATEIAVIAGDNGKRGYNPFMVGDNDGLVTVAETRQPGMETDFVLVRSTHAMLPLDGDVVTAKIRFLDTGPLGAPGVPAPQPSATQPSANQPSA
jgi:hypothetical protein